MDDLIHLFVLNNLENAQEQQFNNNARNPRDPFAILSEKQFINMFRLSKQLFNYLVDTLEPLMRPKLRNTDLDVKTRILIAVKFFGGGSYQLDVACNKFLDVSQATVSNCIKEVVDALNHPTIFNEWVIFPRNFDELNSVRTEFYRQHGFKGVVGCLDCTHVAIVPPPSNDPDHPEHLYVNRKNYHSINVQLICDAQLRIMNVNAKYAGSTNDAFIWKHSNVHAVMRNLHERGHKDYFLLGDSGYPLRTWLFIPLEDDYAPGTPEYTYNRLHKCTRVKIECCNGLLKARFRSLLKHRMLHYKPEMACKIINACVVLHNMCIFHKVPEPDHDAEDVEIDWGIYGDVNLAENEVLQENAVRRVNPELADGRIARRKFIIQNC